MFPTQLVGKGKNKMWFKMKKERKKTKKRRLSGSLIVCFFSINNYRRIWNCSEKYAISKSNSFFQLHPGSGASSVPINVSEKQ